MVPPNHWRADVTPAVNRRHFNGLLATSALTVDLPLRAATELPLFDAHIHYSHDAWELVPPKQAVAILRQAGLRGALVSSSNDQGTQMLMAEAPELIVPELRPYRSRGEISTWVRDDSVLRYLEERLAKYRYVGLGEFHLYGADADLPVPRRMVALARERNLVLHAHSDPDAIERLFGHWPQARILWAHSGFERPEKVRELLRRHTRLWCDLAFRGDHATGTKVEPAWRDAFQEFPDRFMIGTDTFTPERWHYIGSHASYSRGWLADLPASVAQRIGWGNAEALLRNMAASAS
jgi:predicted TIM-barrel fold metal-dependent hydrolase